MSSTYRRDSDPPSCCSSSSSPSSSSWVPFSELQLYQAFIFSVPIFFIFVLLFLFYLFYLRSRSRRTDWTPTTLGTQNENLPRHIHRQSQVGLKKELREMLPTVVYKETFSINDTQCSVCLGDYQVEDRLQQIPACGHTFHAECIDNWLASHTTCPLCRLSLLAPSKCSNESSSVQL